MEIITRGPIFIGVVPALPLLQYIHGLPHIIIAPSANTPTPTLLLLHLDPTLKQQLSPVAAILNSLVLQMHQHLLPLSFQLTALLKHHAPHTQCFVLYDSMKQPCCTDILGAQHVNNDSLVHLGTACFSSPHHPHHHYILPPPQPHSLTALLHLFNHPHTLPWLLQQHVGYVLVSQTYYTFAQQQIFPNFRLPNSHIQLLRLPMDARPQDQYLAFGYSRDPQGNPKDNILLITEEQPQADPMTLPLQLSLALSSLEGQVGQSLLRVNPTSYRLQELNVNTNKVLMQRYALASQLDKYQVFGLVISNTGTLFQERCVKECERLLRNAGKRVFTFVMSSGVQRQTTSTRPNLATSPKYKSMSSSPATNTPSSPPSTSTDWWSPPTTSRQPSTTALSTTTPPTTHSTHTLLSSNNTKPPTSLIKNRNTRLTRKANQGWRWRSQRLGRLQ